MVQDVIKNTIKRKVWRNLHTAELGRKILNTNPVRGSVTMHLQRKWYNIKVVVNDEI